LHQLLTNRVL
jgi:aryl-alcohol dehydrogenase-like predicted oxidoreductase